MSWLIQFILFIISDLSHTEYDDLIFSEDEDFVVVGRKNTGPDVLSTTSQLDSEDSYTEEDIDEDEKDSVNIPLFVFFTCTVKNRLDQVPVTVKGLIPCLGLYYL